MDLQKWRICRQQSLIIMMLVCSSFQLGVQAFSSLYGLSKLPEDTPYATHKSLKDRRRRLTFTLSGESTLLHVRGGEGGEINNSTNNVTSSNEQDEEETEKDDGNQENDPAVEVKNSDEEDQVISDNQVLGNEIDWDDVRGRANISEDKADAIEKDLFLESFREQVQQISQQIQADTMNSFAVLRKEILRRKAQQRLNELAKHGEKESEAMDPQSAVEDNEEEEYSEEEEEDLEPLDGAEALKRDILLKKENRRKRQKLTRAQQLKKKKAREQLNEEILPTIQEETAEPELMDEDVDILEEDFDCDEGEKEKIDLFDDGEDFIVGDTDEEEDSVLDRVESHRTTESTATDKDENEEIGEPEPLTTVSGGVKSRVKRKKSKSKKKKKKKKSRKGIEIVPTIEIKSTIDESLLETKRPKQVAISESIRTVVLTALMLLIAFLASLLLKIVTKTTTGSS